MSASNHLVGVVNFVTFLISIPILGGGVWLSGKANATDCVRFLQWPVIVLGASVMAVSLAGMAGSCYRNTMLMRLYLWFMFLIVAALIGFIIFAYSVTDQGSGRPLLNRAYMDYYLDDYSGWLEQRVSDQSNWIKISSCVRDSKTCAKLRREVDGLPESVDLFYLRSLTSIESGCCKPPTECGYVYGNETTWNAGGGMAGNTADCGRWSNDQGQLCYSCNSCKAGVLSSLKRSWRKVSLINIVSVILLVIFYLVAIAAFRNILRMDNHEPHGAARMTKTQPSNFHF